MERMIKLLGMVAIMGVMLFAGFTLGRYSASASAYVDTGSESSKIISLICEKSLITVQLIQVYISIWKMERGITGNDDDLMIIE